MSVGGGIVEFSGAGHMGSESSGDIDSLMIGTQALLSSDFWSTEDWVGEESHQGHKEDGGRREGEREVMEPILRVYGVKS